MSIYQTYQWEFKTLIYVNLTLINLYLIHLFNVNSAHLLASIQYAY